MRELKVDDLVRVFGLYGQIIAIDPDTKLYQVEIKSPTDGSIETVVIAPAKHVFYDGWRD